MLARIGASSETGATALEVPPAPTDGYGSIVSTISLSTRIPAPSDARATTTTRRARPAERADAPQRRPALLTLASIHDLHLGPVRPADPVHRLQRHPQVVAVQHGLEQRLLREIDDEATVRLGSPPSSAGLTAATTVDAMRALAADDLVPPVYDWLAEDASPAQVRAFLALEGGPDDSFDDLVAIAQVGLTGLPKLEAATNYWDELGDGDLDGVHRTLHRRMLDALDLRSPARADLPIAVLRRTLLCSALATCRARQPELLGVLGLIELQAGPRCRRVVRALQRIDAPPEAERFYAVHAETDPRHGKDWLERVVRPLAADPAWAEGLLRGARWRWAANAAFFDDARRWSTQLASADVSASTTED